MKISSFLPLRERFEKQHAKSGGCWEWTGRLSVAGYGQIKDNYRTRPAHRVSFELHIGPIPGGLCVCHACDNRKCVNPAHLFLGTHKDNTQDKLRKGRANLPKGPDHWNSKLTVGAIQDIRSSHSAGKDLAAKYGLSKSTVTQIRKRQRWAWVENANRRQGQ